MWLPASYPRQLPSWRLLALVLVLLVLAGCGTRQGGGTQVGSGTGPGGYPVGAGDYRRDGPHANPPANLHAVPDAVPRVEPLASGPNRPYVIRGRRYVPDTSWQAYRARGQASWYGRQFHGRPTSSGEPYDMYAMTAAHTTLPIPSYARVTNPRNGRSVVVRINDRGPFVGGRIIDLSYAAAYRLDTLRSGTGDVVVELITPDQIRGGPRPAPSTPSRHLAHHESPAPPSQLRTVGSGAAPAVASAPRNTATATSGPVFLQVGAFGEAGNAQALARRLQASGQMRHPAEVQRYADQLYRVRLGPFADRQQAMAEVDTIFRQTGIMPHLVGN